VARPIGAAVLTFVGGFFILIGGIGLAFVGVFFFAIFGKYSSFFLVGIVLGLLTMAFGALLLALPRLHVVWGVLVIVMAFLSLVFALAGFFLGFLLALIGGILALTYRPERDAMYLTTARTVPPPP
jgi:hypothetical protein